ncbi:MAG: TIGR02217 family protein [Devosiaceae bacterium]
MPSIPGFHDVSFPVPVARGARVTTLRQTDIVTLGSGYEERNTRWRYAKRTYDAGGGVRSLDDLYRVQSFFEARLGQLHAFRFRDPLDHGSAGPNATPMPTDQVIGIGDGSTSTFQLAKSYGDEPVQRPIRLPVAGSVGVAVDGELETNVTIDVLSGTIVFGAGAIPPVGVQITAGFLFDVPTRFDTDTLDIDLTAFKAGSLPTIALREVFLKEPVDA